MKDQIVKAKISELSPRKNNPRVHSRKQIEQIRNSILKFGFITPVLIDGGHQIIAGHGRVEAAKLAGLKQVPALVVDHLTPEQIRAYVIADNKLALNAGWDQEVLKLELQELSAYPGLELTITGFEGAEIDFLLVDDSSDDPADSVPDMEANAAAVSRSGDLWQIGEHRLVCGDATDLNCYRRLLDGELAQQVFTDPPYNVRIDGHVSGLGKIKHSEFQMASGEMTPEQFAQFLETAMRLMSRFSSDGSLHYICMDWRHLEEILHAGKTAYSELKNLCVWRKTNPGMGAFYRSQHELVLVFKNGTGLHINNVELGKHGRNRTNVWEYAGQSGFGSSRAAELAMHPTVKPVALVADAILDASNRGNIILDAFAGSGTTLLAAQKTGRRCFGIELDPQYVDLIIQRLSDRFGLQARHSDLDKTVDEVRQMRRKETENAKRRLRSRVQKAASKASVPKRPIRKHKRAP